MIVEKKNNIDAMSKIWCDRIDAMEAELKNIVSDRIELIRESKSSIGILSEAGMTRWSCGDGQKKKKEGKKIGIGVGQFRWNVPFIIRQNAKRSRALHFNRNRFLLSVV